MVKLLLIPLIFPLLAVGSCANNFEYSSEQKWAQKLISRDFNLEFNIEKTKFFKPFLYTFPVTVNFEHHKYEGIYHLYKDFFENIDNKSYFYNTEYISFLGLNSLEFSKKTWKNYQPLSYIENEESNEISSNVISLDNFFENEFNIEHHSAIFYQDPLNYKETKNKMRSYGDFVLSHYKRPQHENNDSVRIDSGRIGNKYWIDNNFNGIYGDKSTVYNDFYITDVKKYNDSIKIWSSSTFDNDYNYSYSIKDLGSDDEFILKQITIRRDLKLMPFGQFVKIYNRKKPTQNNDKQFQINYLKNDKQEGKRNIYFIVSQNESHINFVAEEIKPKELMNLARHYYGSNNDGKDIFIYI